MIKRKYFMLVPAAKVIIFIIIGYLLTNTTCRDPYEFKPIDDTLVFPPPAPHLLMPPDSYIFATNENEVYFQLNWNPVDSTQVYELELTIVGHPDTLILDSTFYLGLVDNSLFGENSWRVRACSSRWKGWYTEWSELRIFFTSSRFK
jgi:hypothetical protein